MDVDWVAIAFGDVAWISLAFVFGLLSRSMGLPPLVGFLAAGFLLNLQGMASGQMLEKLAELGITLLLFTVGLKLNVRMLMQPQVWAVAGIHTALVCCGFTVIFFLFALLGMPLLFGLDFSTALLSAFALSFSSAVFVVKALEERGELRSLHGRIAIGILIMQDLAAVIFLAASSGKWPSLWALLLLMLIPARPLLGALLTRVGHGELLVLYGFILALGGAELFELVGLKGDLGALVFGVLIASYAKSDELAKTMLGFKDLFLLGFFLSVGLSGQPTWEALMLGVMLTPLVLFKSALFFLLFLHFKLRARTALLATINLSNYSEFGLIVAAIGVANGWIETQWLIAIAIALSLSFAIAAILNTFAHQLYSHNRRMWRRLQREELLFDDALLDIEGAKIAVIGMGGIGTGAYDMMRETYGDSVVGIDIDPVTVANQCHEGRKVLVGDPSDADFWDRIQESHTLELVMLSLPKVSTLLAVLAQLKECGFDGEVAVTARFDDEVEQLMAAGATTVFNVYTEAGNGFSAHVMRGIAEKNLQIA